MAAEETSHAERASALRETLVWMFGMGEPALEHLQRVLQRVAPEDVAAILGDFQPDEKLAIFQAATSREDQGAILEATDQQSRRDLLERLSDAQRLEVLGDMPVDDLVDQLEELSPEEQRRVLATFESEEAREVQKLLQYEPETAGGMMTTDFLRVQAGTTSRDVLTAIQGNPTVEVIAYVYVTDSAESLAGVVSIRDVLLAKPETLVDSYMRTELVTVHVDTDREEVAAVVDKYNFSVVPVVDTRGTMRGIVTFDDVIDAVQEEHSEDMLRMAGTTAIHPFYEPVYIGAAKRLPFLLVTMAGGFGVVFIQASFRVDMRDNLTLFAAMLALGPMISGLAGNVAVVTSTVLVRGLATGEISSARLWRAVGRELAVGVLIGFIVAVLAGFILKVFGGDEFGAFGPLRVSLVVAVGLCTSVAWSALVGGLVPVLCRLSRVIDPAIASGPFVTITCDVSAWLIYLLLVLHFLA